MSHPTSPQQLEPSRRSDWSHDYHTVVPRDVVGNLEYRRKILRLCREKVAYRRAVVEMCRRDPLFYINSFVWQFNPNAIDNDRSGGSRSLELGPFVTWEYQETALREIWACIESRKDGVIEKSREMGASWLCLLLMEWSWHFHKNKKFLLISRDADAVDNPGDPDCLMWKIDFVHRHLPDWLVPDTKRVKFSFENRANNSFITGQASTGKAGVGGRATAMFVDEYSQIKEDREVLNRTSDTTGCRIFNGTHKGTGTAFFDLTVGTASRFLKKIQMHWSKHPDKAKGLYSWDTAEQKIVFHDPEFNYPNDYTFVTDGTPTGGPFPGLRSPWYDEQCQRKSTLRAIAEDLDIDAKGSQEQVFDSLMIRSLTTHCKPPLWEGDLICEAGTWRFADRPNGPLKLWVRLDHRDKPPPGLYCFGVDLSTGGGATNSCASGGNAATGEKILEYARPDIEPTQLAELMVPLAEMFANEKGEPGLLCWETPGPGYNFGKRVIELGFRRIYYRQTDNPLNPVSQSVPGWNNQPASKMDLIISYRDALRKRIFVNRSEIALDECLSFRYAESGNIEHSNEASKNEHSGARVNHGDRVIADALCYKMMVQLRSLGGARDRKPDTAPKVNSLAGRKALAARADRDQAAWA